MTLDVVIVVFVRRVVYLFVASSSFVYLSGWYLVSIVETISVCVWGAVSSVDIICVFVTMPWCRTFSTPKHEVLRSVAYTPAPSIFSESL